MTCPAVPVEGPEAGDHRSKNHQVFAWYPAIQPFDICQAGKNEKFTPGYGDAHAACGEVRFKIVCPENPKHHVRTASYNCHRAACPTCWPGWASRAADDAVSRIEGYREAHKSKFLPRHVSIHPPDGSIESLQQLYDEGRKAAAILGISAAAVVPHHDRLVSETKGYVQSAADDAGINRYEWALSQDNWYELVRYSPHLHLIVYGPLMDSDEFFKKTGWTYRNHDEGAESGRAGDDLKQTIYYLLTHAWVRENHRIIRYWLGMSTHALKCIDIGFDLKTEACPVCHEDCVKTPPDIITADGSVTHFYQNIRSAPVYTVKVRLYRYEIRKRGCKAECRASARRAVIWGDALPPGLCT